MSLPGAEPPPAEPGGGPQTEVVRALLAQPRGLWASGWRGTVAALPATSLAGLCETLIAASLDLVHHDVDEAFHAALAARACARQLGRQQDVAPSRQRRADLLAAAWAVLANACRVQGDHLTAEKAWRLVARLRRHTTSRGETEALICWLRGRLRVDQRRYAEAVEDLHAALREAQGLGNRKDAGKYCLELSAALCEKGDPRAARRWVLEAQRLLQGCCRPRLHFFSLHQEVRVLIDLGQHAQALTLSNALDRHYERFTGAIGLLRGRWVKGRLFASQGQQLAAAGIFDGVRKGFLERGMQFDAALVSLDLALALAHLGERGRVRSLAHEMYEVFRAQQIPREASAALILFAHTALEEQADAGFILQVIENLAEQRRQGVS